MQELIDRGDLQKLVGEAANGTRLLRKASRTLQTSRLALESDPDSSFVLAYDAARQALTALLAQQGLRPTSVGGHFVVERAARAQFGAGFRALGHFGVVGTSSSTLGSPARMRQSVKVLMQ